jgi:hypothetical protein
MVATLGGMTDAAAPALSSARVSEILAGEVARLTSKGYSVETLTPTLAVLAKRRRIGIFWNVVLSIATGGLWLIVVAIRMFNRKADRVTVTVDPTTGRVARR